MDNGSLRKRKEATEEVRKMKKYLSQEKKRSYRKDKKNKKVSTKRKKYTGKDTFVQMSFIVIMMMIDDFCYYHYFNRGSQMNPNN